VSEQHDWVRRLLAETGDSPEPMPADVAERLDRVVAGLAGSPREPGDPDAVHGPVTDPATTPGGTVVPMTRRRHRAWGAALLAAAAITVGGYTVTATGLLGDVTGAGAESAGSSDAGGGQESAADGLATTEEGPASASDGGRDDADADASQVRTLSSATLRRDATALARAAGGDLAALEGRGGVREEKADAAGRGSCVPPPGGVQGTRLRVIYDGQRATAVLRPAAAGRTDVQVWACDAPVRLARVTVPG
jgi:hypothetical protein